MILGYHVKQPELAALIDGGGLISMADIGAIVVIFLSVFWHIQLLQSFFTG